MVNYSSNNRKRNASAKRGAGDDARTAENPSGLRKEEEIQAEPASLVAGSSVTCNVTVDLSGSYINTEGLLHADRGEKRRATEEGRQADRQEESGTGAGDRRDKEPGVVIEIDSAEKKVALRRHETAEDGKTAAVHKSTDDVDPKASSSAAADSEEDKPLIERQKLRRIKSSKSSRKLEQKAKREASSKVEEDDSKMDVDSSRQPPSQAEEMVEVKVEGSQEAPVDPVKDSNFHEGEKILCFHGPLIYEAKIHQVEVRDGNCKYFLHYRGWNKNWDEWVPEARMLKHTEKNVEIQKNLARAHEVQERAKKKNAAAKKRDLEDEEAAEDQPKSKKEHVFVVPKAPSPVVPPTTKGSSSRERRKAGLRPKKIEKVEERPMTDETAKNVVRIGADKKKKELLNPDKPPDLTVETEGQFKSKVEIKIKMPDELKPYIVDDWDYICRQKKLAIIPAGLTVEKIIQDYVKARTANKSAAASKNNKEKAILEVMAGIREYFNVMLGSQLLYKNERDQHAQLLKDDPNMAPCKIYGSIHLLRLFVKLGEFLVYTPLTEKSVQLLLYYINDFLTFLKRNASVYFSIQDYETESLE